MERFSSESAESGRLSGPRVFTSRMKASSERSIACSSVKPSVCDSYSVATPAWKAEPKTRGGG